MQSNVIAGRPINMHNYKVNNSYHTKMEKKKNGKYLTYLQSYHLAVGAVGALDMKNWKNMNTLIVRLWCS